MGTQTDTKSPVTKPLPKASSLSLSATCHRPTSLSRPSSSSVSPLPSQLMKKINKDETDVLKINKVIEMHSQLLKRYDKEVQLNMTYAETISDLNIRLSECEKKLREEKEKSFQLERNLLLWKGRRKGQLAVGHHESSDDPVLRDVVEERNRLARENKEMKNELKSLDGGFFDEIEDLKFSLKESKLLNKKYKRSLCKLCHQFGIPFSPGG